MTDHESAGPAETTLAGHHHRGKRLGVSDLELNLTTLAAPDVPATMRSMLGLRMRSWRIPRLVAEDIELVAAELVSNACAATPFSEIGFRARFSPATGVVWVGAWDSSPRMPITRMPELSLDVIDALPDDHAFGGWGLALVLALASESGIDRTPVGKWVYAIFQGKPE